MSTRDSLIVGRYEDALRDILDLTTGWCGPMTAQEIVAAIDAIAHRALGSQEVAE